MKEKFQELLQILKSKFVNRRKYKVSNEDCLVMILNVLTTGRPWYSLGTTHCHFSTVYKRFRNWSENDKFLEIWQDLIKEYQNDKLGLDSKWFQNLLIDSTMIKNYSGVDCLGRNHYAARKRASRRADRYRLATKVSIICDHHNVPISCSFYPANQNDTTTINKSVEQIVGVIKRPKSKLIHQIIGDKGYVVNPSIRKRRMNNIDFNIVTPYKKNQKKENTKHEKKLLEQRYKIENLFCRLKKLQRLYLRKDRCVSCYKSFFYIGMILVTLENW
jgi:transposase